MADDIQEGFIIKCRKCGSTDVYLSVDYNLSGCTTRFYCNEKPCQQTVASEEDVVTENGEIK